MNPARAPVPAGGKIFGLDLMRAVAVGLVLADHGASMVALWANRPPVALISYGAFYGIEIFFVLSGFLVGGLLIRQAARTAPGGRLRAFRIFMLRRWLRTLPLYYVWMAVLLLVWVQILPSPTRHALAHTLPTYLVMAQNLFWPIQARNFYDVSWSLSVEEWFYLLAATLMFLGLVRLRRLALPLVALLLVAGPIACRALYPPPPSPADQLVPYWLDSIGIGLWVALLEAHAPRAFRAASWLAPLGALCLLEAVYGGSLARFGAQPPLRQVIEVDYVALAIALLVPALARWRAAGGPLAWAVTQIAALSYALYLVHLSVLVYVGNRHLAWGLGPYGAGLVSLAATLLIAITLSYTIERPIMRRRPDDRAVLPHSASSIASPSPEPAIAQSAPEGW